MMKFSLVTTSLNENRSFQEWKNDIEAQTSSPEEIVIVDALSTDGLRAELDQWAEQDGRVKIIYEKSNAAQGRNLAIDRCSGDVVVSTDMGCRIDPRWFEYITRPFRTDKAVDVVAGGYDVSRQRLASSVAWADYYANNGYKGEPKPGFLPSNRSVAYKRSAWRQLGGLPEDLTLCADDYVMSTQLLASNLKIAFAPEAVVHWNRPSRMSAFWREQYRYGVGLGEADLARHHAGYRYAHGGSKTGIYTEAVRQVRSKVRAILRAFSEGSPMAAILIPPLTFGGSVSLNYGVAAGEKRGAVMCGDCRSRTAK